MEGCWCFLRILRHDGEEAPGEMGNVHRHGKADCHGLSHDVAISPDRTPVQGHARLNKVARSGAPWSKQCRRKLYRASINCEVR